MKITILTLFPGTFAGPLSETVIGRAVAGGLLDITLVNPRDFTTDKHRKVDDVPFGGGDGMVMKPEPFVAAIEHVRATRAPDRVLMLSPAGRRLDRDYVAELAQLDGFALVCGRYEGIDARVGDFVDGELSIGDYVLSGGEPAAFVVLDAVARRVPGVLGNETSIQEESFEDGMLEHPQYTRPREFRGRRVPDVLLSGDHARIARWRRAQALRRTHDRRPDLMDRIRLTDEDRRLLESTGTGGD